MVVPPDALPLERALAATNSGIVIADATRQGFPLTYVNAAFERLTGYGADECVGRNCRFLQGPATDRATVAQISRALREGRESNTVLRNYRADGSDFYNELRLAPVRGPDGRVEQIIGVQNDVTDVVQRLERQEAELAELRGLQAALTPPEPPPRPGLELAAAFLPAEAGVAGDFYLVAPGPGGATTIVVGDVMGHGLQAAHRASFVRTALATFSRFTDDPARLLEMANHSLIERIGTTAEFVTAVCASYQPADGRLRWAAAGHPPPLALDTGDPVGALGQVGLPLGIEIDLGVTSAQATLAPGAGVLLATDGLGEARSARAVRAAGPRLGDDRVRELVRGLAGRRARATVDALAAAVLEHTGGQPTDDLCVIALRTTGGAGPAGTGASTPQG